MESKNEPNTTQSCPQIYFSGHPRHGAVGQNIFLMYIFIKRHSWFFKSWWCLLYFGHVRTRTAGKSWQLLTPFCLKLSSNAQTSVISLRVESLVLLPKNGYENTSAACAKVVRDQTRSTTPCGLVRSKRLCAKRYSANSTRKQRVNDLYKSRWKSWRLTNTEF